VFQIKTDAGCRDASPQQETKNHAKIRGKVRRGFRTEIDGKGLNGTLSQWMSSRTLGGSGRRTPTGYRRRRRRNGPWGGGGGESGATSWSSQRTPRRWSREKLKTELSHDLLRAGSGGGKKLCGREEPAREKKPDGGRCPVGIESGRAGRVRVLNTYSVPRYLIALLYIYIYMNTLNHN